MMSMSLLLAVGCMLPAASGRSEPKCLYQNDARIVLELARVTGDYASLAELRLFQVEDGTGGSEGVQGLSGVGSLNTRMLTCAPSPSNRATTISYELGCSGPVALTVHDASGRLVRRLEGGFRPAGRYDAKWTGTDDHGTAVPAGVYFVRFNADGETASRRVTLVR